MELGLSLGAAASKPFEFMEKSHDVKVTSNKSLGFCMGLSIGPTVREDDIGNQRKEDDEEEEDDYLHDGDKQTTTPVKKAEKRCSSIIPIQLNLLPNTPVVPRNRTSFLVFPRTSDNGSSEVGCSSGQVATRGFDVNKFPLIVEESPEDGAAALSSSPKSNNSAASSFQMDFCIYSNSTGGNSSINNNKRDFEGGGDGERASSRASDEDENGSTRKKLRLSKDQSAFLEESFKEHNTLNPKQKLALAKQLNLRPRQVEVWFQNRRARTKLKQTEVDCEYLKRCCETLTEENRRLQKELQELRTLKTSNPFYMQLPATTLTMCPSCERVATTNISNPPPLVTTATVTNSSDPTSNASSTGLSLSTGPKLFPFSPKTSPAQQLEKI